MKQITGDLFNMQGFDIKVITTNGFVKNNGEAVMGRGCAKPASKMWSELPAYLGKQIREHGNHVHHIASIKTSKAHFELDKANSYELYSFPVKPTWERQNGKLIPGWACKAQLELIARSAHELVKIVGNLSLKEPAVLLPRPGCGNGERTWKEVEPILNEILDNRFTTTTFAKGGK